MSRFYDALETRAPEEREAELMSALQIQLAHAKAHTRYGEILTGINPADIVTRQDMAKLPVTRKHDLLDYQQQKKPFGGMVAARQEHIKYIFSSPGPVYEPATARPDYFRSARALFAAGFRAGDVIHNCFSYHLTPAGVMFDSGAHALGCAVVPAGVGQTELQVATIEDVRPDGYVGTPSFLKIIIEKAEETGADISSMKKALVTGEALPPSLRQWIRDRGIEVRQCYGTADLGIVAYETEPDKGMLVNEGVFLELVNPGTGEPVASEGDVGEIVVTTMNPDYPLIRYATGDLSAMMSGQSECGRTASRIKGWMGRADQSAKVRGMFIHPHQVSGVQSRLGAGRVRLVVTTRDHADYLECLVESDDQSDNFRNRVTDTVREICKVRAVPSVVNAGAFPDDGLLIDDQRTFD